MTMTREEAKEYIISHATEHLQRDKKGKGFICPICGSGNGRNGTGITSKDGNRHFSCWAGCFSGADIIDIIGFEYSLKDFNDKLQKAADIYGVTIEKNTQSEYVCQNRNTARRDSTHTRKPEYKPEPEPDYTDFFIEANRNLPNTDYHRGISTETLNRFNVGFVVGWRHPKRHSDPLSPRLIIPTSKHSYLARHASSDNFINFRGEAENKSKVGAIRIFNIQALQTSEQPIFIVEGEIDALSIIDIGGEAIGVGSIAYIGHLLKAVQEHKPKQPLIIALDKEQNPDTAARVEQAAVKLETGLKELGISFYRKDITGTFKDANEALNTDKEAFIRAVGKAVREVEESESAALDLRRMELKREAVLYSLDGFIDGVRAGNSTSFVPTGFTIFDNLLDGGLYAGLYIVGAISSLGKTTFCLQIADQIAEESLKAKNGRDVLVFSLEMAREELIAKSISRLTCIQSLAEIKSTIKAQSTRGILTGTRYMDYSDEEIDLINSAVDTYREYAGNVYITEGMGNVGVFDIRSKVSRHIEITGKLPVVIIDYLQILAPTDPRATDKQNTDKAVLELKRLSRDYKIPVIGISSFNRDNYTAPVNLTSFKESGAIEYSSDVLIGLQYEGMDYQEGETDKNREKRIRELVKNSIAAGSSGRSQKIQVKVLKNRNGSKGEVLFDFFPMFNYFKEWFPDFSSGSSNDDNWENVPF